MRPSPRDYTRRPRWDLVCNAVLIATLSSALWVLIIWIGGKAL